MIEALIFDLQLFLISTYIRKVEGADSHSRCICRRNADAEPKDTGKPSNIKGFRALSKMIYAIKIDNLRMNELSVICESASPFNHQDALKIEEGM
ncbi:hypothetical protein [Paenibacillus montaniterrae]|uniref:hypothetical protein n=1 Tax=Paenibacillus montaniterrae TaxID=429341 RepID=UPI001BCEEB27|nr:hypothetical protein [Paenibacillus montaniterrae]